MNFFALALIPQSVLMRLYKLDKGGKILSILLNCVYKFLKMKKKTPTVFKGLWLRIANGN